MAVNVTTTKTSNGKFVVEKIESGESIDVDSTGHLSVIGPSGRGSTEPLAIYAPGRWIQAEVETV